MNNITVLPGDGIGPEVINEAIKVLNAIDKKTGKEFNYEYGLIGGSAYDKTGEPLPEDTLELCKKSPYILFGAVGGPKWDSLPPDKRPEKAILGLRKKLSLFANLRPALIFESLIDSSPLSKKVLKDGLDIMVVRELTGGIYFGEPRGREESGNGFKAYDTMVYSTYEIERIGKVAFEIAKKRNKKVTSVDKSNVLESSRLWREVISDIASSYQDVVLEHLYVDNCAMQLAKNPGQFDVIVTGNMFGDILSDEASILTGSIGMLPSASMGEGKNALYEPIHGSAPDIAGQGKANPIAAILSAAMLLKYSLGMIKESNAIEKAVNNVLENNFRTPDIYEKEDIKLIEISTKEMGDKIVEELYNINI